MASGKKLQLSRQEQEKYTRIFMDLDTDRNGWLSREELGVWLKESGFALNKQQTEKIFRTIDTNEDGRVSLDEFYTAIHLFKKPPTQSDDLLRVFRNMDLNNDGQLSEDELHKGFNSCGYNFSKAQIRKIVANLDKNADGQISFQEFMAFFQ